METAPSSRSAVVDLGSNSVRLVVFDGISRNPVTIFNEKAVLRLGQGLTKTGRLNEDGVEMAMEVLSRYNAIARSMNAAPFEILATAAVRDAANGKEFVESIRRWMPDVPIRILSGEEEADHSAIGVRCGIPEARGLAVDIGGGSLELIRLQDEARTDACSLKLGVIRLRDRSDGNLTAAKILADEDLSGVGWLAEMKGQTLYLVGGAFRALGRLQIARTNYPLNILHYYMLTPEEALDMTSWLIRTPRRTLERLPGAPRKRLDDVPFAATVLRRLLKKVSPDRVVFCVDGLREGWYVLNVAKSREDQDPMLVTADEMCRRLGRSDTLPDALVRWTAGLFPDETPEERRLRETACRLSDTGSHDHPEYRAEQSYIRVLWLQGAGLSHQARAFLALTTAIRYEAGKDAPWLQSARDLLGTEDFSRAVILGLALRLAYTISGGTEELLKDTAIIRQDGQLVLKLTPASVAARGDSVRRRLSTLGQAMGLEAGTIDLPE
ncbi:Ppx/GppA family phosphatase [Acetobacter sp. AN02]|uniref:Ppx/GppA family phosphatase n=1 Tax=Acetobacter sp. AN02 TaxID=2894186 RepID=UPI0024345CC7|nr:Ppx/GppA family phosphatase [Acetobacter sp. AN02]MDG6095202.1 Ppx/GppA family phosphatase [Acetobacter sp. AN02]